MRWQQEGIEMFPLIKIGPLSIPSRGLILLLGLWLALSLCDHLLKRAKNPAIRAEAIFNLATIALIVGLIGARLAYAARHPGAFIDQPLALILPTGQMLDAEAGLLFGILTALIYIQRKGLPFWATLDSLTPGLALLAIAIPLADLAAGTAYGAPTTLPWGIWLWNDFRHPSQVYALLAGVVLLVVSWPRGTSAPDGRRFLTFAALSCALRLILETWRGDSILLTGSIRLWQVLAWLGMLASLWLLEQKRRSTDATRPPDAGR
jgi:prolipoprotein diacylglyceryltransferase